MKKIIVLVAGICLIAYTLFVNDKPNVILIVSDATRADHLGVYGYNKNTSPNIDKFARDGVLFLDTRSQSTHTKLAVPAIIASVYPTQHGITNYGHALSDSFTTMAEILKAEGYQTVGFVTNVHLQEVYGFAQGFDDYWCNRYFEHDHPGNVTNAEDVVDDFVNWLDTEQQEPFFAFLFFIDQHAPYTPPVAFVEGDTSWRNAAGGWGDSHIGAFEGADRQGVIDLYDGEIRYFDSEFGRLMSELKKRELYDNSIIIYTSDHGEAFWEHGLVGHGTALYDEMLKVPLVVKWPKSGDAIDYFKPGHAAEPTAHVDILPMLCERLGIDAPRTVDTGIVSELYLDQKVRIDQDEPYLIASIVKNDLKLIITHHQSDSTTDIELFDIHNNPKELVNLAGKLTARTQHLKNALSVASGRMVRERYAPAQRGAPTQHELAELKALGYVE